MTSHYETIRAALEGARTTARICVLGGLAKETDDALIALDKLERAASEPVAYQYAHPYFGGAKIWREEQRWNGHTSDESRALYTAPPIPDGVAFTAKELP